MARFAYIAVLGGLLALGAHAEPGDVDSPSIEPASSDSLRALTRRVGLLSRRMSSPKEPLLLSFAQPSGLRVKPPDFRLAALQPRPITRLESVAYGADTGAFTALAVGAMGSWTGVWEEETAWYMMGAGAALGAIWGATMDNDRVKISIGASPNRDGPSSW